MTNDGTVGPARRDAGTEVEVAMGLHLRRFHSSTPLGMKRVHQTCPLPMVTVGGSFRRQFNEHYGSAGPVMPFAWPVVFGPEGAAPSPVHPAPLRRSGSSE